MGTQTAGVTIGTCPLEKPSTPQRPAAPLPPVFQRAGAYKSVDYILEGAFGAARVEHSRRVGTLKPRSGALINL